MKYSNYLQTPHWKKTRKLKLGNNPACEICSVSIFLHIHHRHYKKNGRNILFNEDLDSLSVLCNRCHKIWHNTYGLEKHKYKEIRNAGRLFAMGLTRKDAIELCSNEKLYRLAFKCYIKKQKLGYISKKDILKIKKLQKGSDDFPQFHAERCPVCAGWGEVGKPGLRKPCHGCGGRGYVEVPNFDTTIEEEK